MFVAALQVIIPYSPCLQSILYLLVCRRCLIQLLLGVKVLVLIVDKHFLFRIVELALGSQIKIGASGSRRRKIPEHPVLEPCIEPDQHGSEPDVVIDPVLKV